MREAMKLACKYFLREHQTLTPADLFPAQVYILKLNGKAFLAEFIGYPNKKVTPLGAIAHFLSEEGWDINFVLTRDGDLVNTMGQPIEIRKLATE